MARKSETANASSTGSVSDEQVAAFLHDHPEFLVDHPELITTLTLPARFDAGPVVDLQQHVIGRLREEVEQLRGCAEHLISTSRSNMSTQTRTHEAALALLDAGSMTGLARVVADDLPGLLDVDVATIGFETGEGPSPLMAGILTLPNGLLDRILGDGEVMLRASTTGDPALFGDGAGLVSSCALVRLTPNGLPGGVIALGSRNERGFHNSQGTELLSFLARIVEDCVVRWWPAA
ncbi:DUF484 family protein [Telmatospirillum sp.]|uniref:DUF484 family protein n=1 Tax=Telmatospirillum sp. TaxID=2079197 RepID=UPI002851EAEE|nr:DUF484 family protein [Telmatospirillum sp.]MDR3441094.1 DUF484 family protein [Telmatospirillum sp.]